MAVSVREQVDRAATILDEIMEDIERDTMVSKAVADIVGRDTAYSCNLLCLTDKRLCVCPCSGVFEVAFLSPVCLWTQGSTLS